jgi:hypothetical protein
MLPRLGPIAESRTAQTSTTSVFATKQWCIIVVDVDEILGGISPQAKQKRGLEERSRTLLKSWLVRHIGVFAEPADLQGLFIEIVVSVE